MEITKMLTISTAHITEETARLLELEPDNDNMQLIVYNKADFGWFIYVNEYLENRDIPDDLRKCLELAKENDCKWLCLECDTDVVDGLDEYEW